MCMNTKILRCTMLWLALAGLGRAQTIDWGSPVWSNLLDSSGTALASGSYAFELGTFGSFVPLDSNISSWSANWKPFDQASYSQTAGYFGSSATMDSITGHSSNSIGGSTDFSGQSAYLFVRNTAGDGGTFASSGEYLLARNASWTFPVLASSPNPGCCDNALPLEWSVSDLVANNTCIAPANVPTLKTGVAGSSGLVYAEGSIFQWDLYADSNSSNERGTAYSAVNVVGNLTVDPNAIFKIILHDGGDFTDAFWQTQHTWSDIFAATGSLSGSWSTSQLAVYSSGDCCNPLAIGSYGGFSFSGTALTFTPAPEPSGAIISLLLAGGLLRRHRPAQLRG